MNTRKFSPPTFSARSNSTDSSPRCSSSSSDTDEDRHSSMADQPPSRPLSVTIPQNGHLSGSYCQRRPNLSEILANTAPPPWTLSAFMAYLSQNHCLETLEFTMDASRYRKHYAKMHKVSAGSPVSPSSEDCSYVRMLWTRLMDAYIAPNGPREVNLPSDVRDRLLSLSNSYLPPHPSALDPAVSKVYELMEESVLVPFLNSLCPQSNTDVSQAFSDSSSYYDENGHRSTTSSYHSQFQYPQQPQQHPHIIASSAMPNAGGYHQRQSAPAPLTNSLSRTSMHTRFASGPPRLVPGGFTHTNTSGSGSEIFTDESGSTNSPISEVLTPPTTPPMSDHAMGQYGSNTPSPRSSRGEHTLVSSVAMGSFAGATAQQWKRVSSKLGWKKRSSDVPDQEYDGRTF